MRECTNPYTSSDPHGIRWKLLDKLPSWIRQAIEQSDDLCNLPEIIRLSELLARHTTTSREALTAILIDHFEWRIIAYRRMAQDYLGSLPDEAYAPARTVAEQLFHSSPCSKPRRMRYERYRDSRTR